MFLLLQESKGDFVIKFPANNSGARTQIFYPNFVQFPCRNVSSFGKSKVTPTSVHKLRPGDITVIGAMGDSLIAGNGALEEWAIGTLIEYRGVSWCAGS